MLERFKQFIANWHFRQKKGFSKFSGIMLSDQQHLVERHIQAKYLVLVGSKEHPKWVHFLCPCGCQQAISLNLMKSYSPHWDIQFHKGSKVSIYPSVYNMSCGAHFWIRQNKVSWARFYND